MYLSGNIPITHQNGIIPNDLISSKDHANLLNARRGILYFLSNASLWYTLLTWECHDILLFSHFGLPFCYCFLATRARYLFISSWESPLKLRWNSKMKFYLIPASITKTRSNNPENTNDWLPVTRRSLHVLTGMLHYQVPETSWES